jgi:Mn2+/Fe2+ NRAMP family transporter
MRVLLFLGALGVVMQGLPIDGANPPASMFRQAAGMTGYKLFGLVMWSASITSVVGSAYTSVSFLRSLHLALEKRHIVLTIAFIMLATGIFLFAGNPVTILILAGALNGMILPVSLAVMLLAAYRTKIVGAYRHPVWLTVTGVTVMLVMGWMAVYTINKL